MTSFNLKRAIADYYSLVRVITNKSLRGASKAIAEIGSTDNTSMKNRCCEFEYKTLKGVIYQDQEGNMKVNDFLFVLDGLTNEYVPYYSAEHIYEDLVE